jgi:D-amino-acid dehydrogenase
MQVLQQALSVAPGLAAATLHELRVGLRPMGPGTTPLLGPVPGWQGLIMANGLGAGGLTMGPYAGALVARSTLGQTIDVPLGAYSLPGC